jgi:CRP-like cAMP-binding protein
MIRNRRPSSPLDGVPAICSWPDDVRSDLTRHADVVAPRPGTVLARRGTAAREVALVRRGEVLVLVDGHHRGRIPPGGSFGAFETATGADHPYDYVAGDGVELVVVNGPAYRGAADRIPSLAAPSPVGADPVLGPLAFLPEPRDLAAATVLA